MVNKTETPVPVAPVVPQKTEADKIWDDIKGLPMQMFGLQPLAVENYCSPVRVEPSGLYVIMSVGAALPALENAIGHRFTVELGVGYVVVRRIPAPIKR